jgi:hypothetical protein
MGHRHSATTKCIHSHMHMCQMYQSHLPRQQAWLLLTQHSAGEWVDNTTLQAHQQCFIAARQHSDTTGELWYTCCLATCIHIQVHSMTYYSKIYFRTTYMYIRHLNIQCKSWCQVLDRSSCLLVQLRATTMLSPTGGHPTGQKGHMWQNTFQKPMYSLVHHASFSHLTLISPVLTMSQSQLLWTVN